MSFPVLNQPVDPVAELSQQAADLDPNTMTPRRSPRSCWQRHWCVR